jgi:hypothetical protein
VTDTAVNMELMQQFFGQLLGAVEAPEPAAFESKPQPSTRPATYLPEMTILGTEG